MPPSTTTTIRKIGEAAYNLYYMDRAKTPEDRIESFLAAIEDISVLTIAGWDDALCAYLQASVSVPHCREKLKEALTLLCQPAPQPMQGIRRRKDYDTTFPNDSAIRAAELIDGGETETNRDELIECLRELYSFGRDEDTCKANGINLAFESPALTTADSLKTIQTFIEDGRVKSPEGLAGSEDSETYGFSLILFLLLQVIAVYIRRWLDKVLP